MAGGEMIPRIFLGVAVGIALLGNPKAQIAIAAPSAVLDPAEKSPGAIDLDLNSDISRQGQKPQIGNPLWGIPLGTLSATRDRPIFSPSRRPPQPVTVAAPYIAPPQPITKPAGPTTPLLTLIGTVVGENESIGVFIDQTTKDLVRLKTGDSQAGWSLRSIRGREVSFENGGQTVTLTLPKPSEEQPAEPSIPGPDAEPAGPRSLGIRPFKPGMK
jgi:hypothetical protein